MSSNSSQNENEFSHRQGSVTSLPDEDDQITTASDPSTSTTTFNIIKWIFKIAKSDDINHFMLKKNIKQQVLIFKLYLISVVKIIQIQIGNNYQRNTDQMINIIK